MNYVILASFTSSLFGVLLTVMAVFLILLVLVQRGRGGGLAGALGGMGGSSAFGAKAGDVFTRITIVAAAIWIILCIAAAKWGSSTGSRINVTTRAGGAAATLESPKSGKDAATTTEAPPEGASDTATEATAPADGAADGEVDANSDAAPASEK